MKKLLLLGMATLATAALLVGCSDDDECATCPPGDPQRGLVIGHVVVQGGELECWGAVLGIDGALPALDSVKVGNIKADTEFGLEGIVGWSFGYEGPAGSLSSGDNVQVTFYMPAGTAAAQVKLLDEDTDNPTGFNHPIEYPYDTVAIGETVVVSWDAVANADWYNIEVDYSYDSAGTHADWYEEYYQAGTSFTIPGASLDYNGYVYVYVNPVSGPMPDAGGNVTGDLLDGAIVSTVYESLRIYVGTGDAWPSSGERSPRHPGQLSVDDLMRMYQ